MLTFSLRHTGLAALLALGLAACADNPQQPKPAPHPALAEALGAAAAGPARAQQDSLHRVVDRLARRAASHAPALAAARRAVAAAGDAGPAAIEVRPR